jgi:hypothetical protein
VYSKRSNQEPCKGIFKICIVQPKWTSAHNLFELENRMVRTEVCIGRLRSTSFLRQGPVIVRFTVKFSGQNMQQSPAFPVSCLGGSDAKGVKREDTETDTRCTVAHSGSSVCPLSCDIRCWAGLMDGLFCGEIGPFLGRWRNNASNESIHCMYVRFLSLAWSGSETPRFRHLIRACFALRCFVCIRINNKV